MAPRTQMPPDRWFVDVAYALGAEDHDCAPLYLDWQDVLDRVNELFEDRRYWKEEALMRGAEDPAETFKREAS